MPIEKDLPYKSTAVIDVMDRHLSADVRQAIFNSLDEAGKEDGGGFIIDDATTMVVMAKVALTEIVRKGAETNNQIAKAILETPAFKADPEKTQELAKQAYENMAKAANEIHDLIEGVFSQSNPVESSVSATG